MEKYLSIKYILKINPYTLHFTNKVKHAKIHLFIIHSTGNCIKYRKGAGDHNNRK